MTQALSPQVIVVGTFDTKGTELLFIRDCICSKGLNVTTVDVSALYDNRTRDVSLADVSPEQIAQYHPEQLAYTDVFHPDRGTAIKELLQCLARFVLSLDNIAGIIGVGGSGGTALLSPAMRALDVGVPKLLVSTVASGNTQPYVGASDLTMMYSVADIAGLNTITREVLTNAAYAMAGMCQGRDLIANRAERAEFKPAIGLTMFGVTTPCVTAVQESLEEDYDCLIFHATGSGGLAMERLAAEKQLSAVIDLTTTEITDHLCAGVFSAGESRLDSIISSELPYIGSVGAIEIINFGTMQTVPESYRSRPLYQHNPQVTLVRTNIEENIKIAKWIADKLNQCSGQVRFLLPERGVSLLSVAGKPFYDPDADTALFDTLEAHFQETATRKLIRLPCAINDSDFSRAVVEHFIEINT